MDNKCYSWMEIIIDRLVPFAVIGLLIIIIIDFFFSNVYEKYHLLISIADYIIIGIFIVDLVFKYLRIKNFKNFLKTCWLDIIAIFPFFLIFRVFESILIFTEIPKETRSIQLIFHEGLEASRIVKDVEAAGKTSRVKTIIALFEKIEKTPRIVKALPFYEQPVGKHHLHEVQGKKEYLKTKQEINNAPKEIIKETEKEFKKTEKYSKEIIKDTSLKNLKKDIKTTIPKKLKKWTKQK